MKPTQDILHILFKNWLVQILIHFVCSESGLVGDDCDFSPQEAYLTLSDNDEMVLMVYLGM